jgi:DNA-directed RNA polymerase specialized sigma24 family protein
MRGISGPEFEAAITQHREALLGWAVQRVGQVEAEDLVQDALLRAIAIESRPRSSWRTWLFAIIRYVYLERVERLARQPVPAGLVEGMVATDLRGHVGAAAQPWLATHSATG